MIVISPSESLDLAALLQRLQDHMPRILESRTVQLGYLYGSAAEDATTPLSDVDIALVTGQRLSPLQQLELELEVQVELGHSTGVRNADVRIIDRAPLLLRGQVVTRGKLLFVQDDEFRIEFETRTRDEYFDFKPIADGEREAFFTTLVGE